MIAIGLVGAFAVLSLIPHTKTWFTSLGSASLVVYLFHGFFIKGAEYAGVPDWAASVPVTVRTGLRRDHGRRSASTL